MTSHMIFRNTFIVATLALSCLPLRGFAEQAAPSPVAQTAEKLYASLTDDQRKQATLPLNDPQRDQQQFTGGKRAGVKIRSLNPEQQKMAMDLLTGFTSDYGKAKALAITEQKPNNPAD